MAKKAPKRNLKDKFNAAYEQMEYRRMKEKDGKSCKYCKGDCKCGR